MNDIKNPATLFGVTFSKDNVNSELFNERFEVLEDCDDIIKAYITKDTYTHPNDGDIKSFKYRYVLEVFTPYPNDENSDRVYFNLLMVIYPKSLTEKQAMELDKEDWFDVYSEGLYVVMASSDFKADEVNVEEILTQGAFTLRTIDPMRGVWLDASKNRLGNNGWDYIRNILYKTSLFELAMERHKKRLM